MGVFWLFLLIPHSHCLEVRAREGEGESETSQAGMTLLHNVCCCCTTRSVTLRITTTQSSTKRCVWEAERDGAERVVCSAARGWARGLLLIVQLSLLIMSLSNQCKRRQEPKWHFSTLITHVSFVAQPSFAFTRLQSFWSGFFPSAWAYGLIHLGDAQCHKWEKPKRCVWKKKVKG